MKAFPSLALVLLFLSPAVPQAQAGEGNSKSGCKLYSDQPFTKTDYALLPFRAIPWAAYYIVRLPGLAIEYALYGETGERMAGIPDAAPSLH
jgi:hypothetical protein